MEVVTAKSEFIGVDLVGLFDALYLDDTHLRQLLSTGSQEDQFLEILESVDADGRDGIKKMLLAFAGC